MTDWLDEIEQRATGAESGPWFAETEVLADGADPHGLRVSRTFVAKPDAVAMVSTRLNHRDRDGAPRPDAERGRWRATQVFIAHARQDVPRLVAEVRRLRALVAEREGMA